MEYPPIKTESTCSIGPAFKVRQPSGQHSLKIVCQCKCSTHYVADYYATASGMHKSCGCMKRDAVVKRNKDNAKHGEAVGNGTKEYRAWRRMLFSCYNENAKEYDNYGGRGIKVCDRWLDPANGFTDFLSCVGRAPSPKHSIDRIDVNGHYEPKNVRWATSTEQGRNRRNNRLLTAFGETKTLSEFSAQFNVCSVAVAWRLDRGWSVEDALTKPMQKKTPGIPGLAKMAKENNIDVKVVRARLCRGWELVDALRTPIKHKNK